MEKRTINIAHFVSTLSRTSGVLSVIMNYYRHIDRERFRFDFLYFKDAAGETYHDEIMRLGGRCVRWVIFPLHAFFANMIYSTIY